MSRVARPRGCPSAPEPVRIRTFLPRAVRCCRQQGHQGMVLQALSEEGRRRGAQCQPHHAAARRRRRRRGRDAVRLCLRIEFTVRDGAGGRRRCRPATKRPHSPFVPCFQWVAFLRDFVFSWPALDSKIPVRLRRASFVSAGVGRRRYLIVPMVTVTPASPKFPLSPPPPYTVRDPAATTAVSYTSTDRRSPAATVTAGILAV